MSIYAYVGLPGSGKSYGVVANQIVPSLKEKRTVVTNLPVKVTLLRELIPDCDIRTFSTSQIAENPESIDEVFPAGCVAVIDEVWRLWPAGTKVDRIPEAFKSFLAEHRHRVDKNGKSTQIVLVTQDLAQVAAFARQLVEQTFVHRKLGSLGMRGRYTVGVYDGHVTGLTPPESKRINLAHGRYKDEFTRLYESHTMSQSKEAGADEDPIDDRGNVWRRPMLWVGLVGAIAAMAWGGQWVYGAVKKPESAVGGAVGVRPTGARASHPPAMGPRAVLAQTAVWRVAGYLKTSDENGYALLTDGEREEFVPLTACQVSKFRARCEFQGEWIDSRSAPRAVGEPIGTYDSSGGPAKAGAAAP